MELLGSLWRIQEANPPAVGHDTNYETYLAALLSLVGCFSFTNPRFTRLARSRLAGGGIPDARGQATGRCGFARGIHPGRSGGSELQGPLDSLDHSQGSKRPGDDGFSIAAQVGVEVLARVGS